uniref:Uncharacterized protein n=1 Tax=Pithovirus LCPAC201 TaxID=2506591 RepID=A0A481Z5M4_9VIRU|nr:MAG: hypothetical protein LCPAC201_01460 [Pithovirus LCPAC201]
MDPSSSLETLSGPVTIIGIKKMLKTEQRVELKTKTYRVLEWLNSDRIQNGAMTLLELDSFNQLGKVFPYDILFETLRRKYLPADDVIVVKRLGKLTALYPVFFSKEGTQKIEDYLWDSKTPLFDYSFYKYLTVVELMIAEVLNDMEEGENDEYLCEMSSVVMEIQLIQYYLLESVDAGDSSENDE